MASNLLTRLFRRSDDIARGMTVADYIRQVTAQYGTYYPPVVSYGPTGQPTERPPQDFEGLVTQAFAANPIVYGLVTKRGLIYSEARFMWQDIADGRPGDLSWDDGLSLLEKPWPNGSTGEMLMRIDQDVSLAGNAYIVRDGDRLRRLRPDWVQIVLSGDPREEHDIDVVGYVYGAGSPDSGTFKPYLPDEVAHISPVPDPLAAYRGMSWLTPVIREVQADKQATEHKLSFLKNGAVLGPVVKAPPGISVEQFKRFIEAAESAHAGPSNSGKWVFLANGADVQTVSANLKDIDLKALTASAETRMTVAALMPAVIAGVSEGLQGSSLNAGNYQAAKRAFADGTLRPLWRITCAELETILDVPEGKRLWFDETGVAFLREDQQDVAGIQAQQATTINTLVTAGFRPESIVVAVRENDWSKLEHSGLTSVQLTPPGMGAPGAPAADADGDGQPDAQPQDQQGEDAYQAALEELRASRAALLDAADLLRSQIWSADDDEETQRSYTAALASFRSEDVERADRYSIRTPAGMRSGKSRGGQFRSLSAAVIGALEAWINGEGDDDPLEDFTPEQLHKAASQLGVQAPQGTSKPRLKLALLHKAREDRREQGKEATEGRRRMPSGYRVERLEDGRWSVQTEGGSEFAQADSIEQARGLAEADRDRRQAGRKRRDDSRLPGGGPTPPARPPVTPMTVKGKTPRKLTDAEKVADALAAGRISERTAISLLTGRPEPEGLDAETAGPFATGMVHAGYITELAWTGDRDRLEAYLRRQNSDTLQAAAPFFGLSLPSDGGHEAAVAAFADRAMQLEAPRRELPSGEELRQSLLSRKVKDLQGSLRAAGLPVSGRKADLVDRLVAAYSAARGGGDDATDRPDRGAGLPSGRDGRGRGPGAARPLDAGGEPDAGAVGPSAGRVGGGGGAGRVAPAAPAKKLAQRGPKPTSEMTPAALRDELQAGGAGQGTYFLPIGELNLLREDLARAVERLRAGGKPDEITADLRQARVERKKAAARAVLDRFFDRGREPTPEALSRAGIRATKPDTVVRFNPAFHEVEGDQPVGLADRVVAVSPGYYIEVSGERQQVIKARVRAMTEADEKRFTPPPVPRLDPPPPGRKELTGSALNDWSDHFKYDQQYGRHEYVDENGDTPPEGVRVRDLRVTLHSDPDGGTAEYVAAHGTAWRIGGVSYLIEHGPDEYAAPWVAKMLASLREAHDAIPGARRANTSYAVLLGRNPGDAYWQRKFNNPDHTAAMSAGGGRVFIWSPEDYMRRSGAVAIGSLRHETGHNLDQLIGRTTTGSESEAWAAAARGDTPIAAQLRALRERYGTRRDWAPTFDPSRAWPYGVTPYGQSSSAEDFAEATELYQVGVIGRGRLVEDGPIVDLYFRDVFPNRAAILDAVFPDIARDQIETIAAARIPASQRSIAELRKIVAGYGITIPGGLSRDALVALVNALWRGVPPRDARATASATVRRA